MDVIEEAKARTDHMVRFEYQTFYFIKQYYIYKTIYNFFLIIFVDIGKEKKT